MSVILVLEATWEKCSFVKFGQISGNGPYHISLNGGIVRAVLKQCVIFHCDIKAIVHVVNNQTPFIII